jgi:hypothetical protein
VIYAINALSKRCRIERGESMSEVTERKITAEDIAKLVEKAQPHETKYLLFLETQTRPGESFSEHISYEVVYGEVEEVLLEHYYDYPTDNRRRYMIIPKKVPTVIVWWHYWDFGPQDIGEEKTVYVFTADGWRKVDVQL